MPLLTLVLLAGSLAAARPAPSAEPASPAPSASAAPAARLAHLAWMVGRWRGREGPDSTEEAWTAPEGGAMFGTWRWVRDGKARLYELLVLAEEEQGVVLRFRHFDARLVGWEEKDRPLALPLVSWREGEAVFAGEDRDGGPLRVTYRREGSDGLRATVEKDSGRQEYPMRRAAP